MSQALTPPPDKVAFEWLGMARKFRNSIDSTDAQVNETIEAMGAYGLEIIRRRYSFRYEQLQHIERTLRLGLPENGRLALTHVMNKRKGKLIVCDIRVVAGTFRHLDWADESFEESLSLVIIDSRFGPGTVRIKNMAIAAISLHAIARRYQRSFNHRDKSVLKDLSSLALNANKLLENDGDFRCETGDGAWIGKRMLAEHHDVPQRILAVRTWLP
jgi:hypothetical protein